MKYASLEHYAGLAIQYDTLALAAISQVHNRFLPWTNSSLRPGGIQVALNDIAVNERKRVLELGSGISTVFVAAALAQNGGKLVTVDHDGAWQSLVRGWLKPEQAAATEFVHAPLLNTTFDEQSVEWYDPAKVVQCASAMAPFDLLLIDGPPAYQTEHCLNRGPAIERLRGLLSPSATIILDDINRTGERHIARCWSELLGVSHRCLTVEAGVAIWTMGKSNNISQ